MPGIDETEAPYREVDEDSILEQIMICSWPCDTAHGPREPLRRRAAQTLERWLAGGLPYRVDAGRRMFSAAEVIRWLRSEELAGGPSWFGPGGPQARRVVGAFGPNARGGAPARFQISLRRELSMRGRRPDAPLRLGLPFPCEHPSQGDATVELVEGAGARVTAHSGHLDVRLPAPGASPAVTVAVKISFTARGKTFDVDPARLVPPDRASPELERFTRLDDGVVRVTPFLQRLASELAGDARSPWDMLERFWSFGLERLKFGHIHYAELDPADPLASLLRQGWSDCRTGSSLLVALCRARGVPARMVSGLLLYPDVPAVNHYWFEALLPPYGWVPFDLGMSWGLAFGEIARTEWSRYFFGRIDYRMRIEHLPSPLLFGSGIRFPPVWYLLERSVAHGVETRLYERGGQQPVYRDHLAVQWQPIAPGTGTIEPWTTQR